MSFNEIQISFSQHGRQWFSGSYVCCLRRAGGSGLGSGHRCHAAVRCHPTSHNTGPTETLRSSTPDQALGSQLSVFPPPCSERNDCRARPGVTKTDQLPTKQDCIRWETTICYLTIHKMRVGWSKMTGVSVGNRTNQLR